MAYRTALGLGTMVTLTVGCKIRKLEMSHVVDVHWMVAMAVMGMHMREQTKEEMEEQMEQMEERMGERMGETGKRMEHQAEEQLVDCNRNPHLVC